MQRHLGVPAYLFSVFVVFFAVSVSWGQSAPQSRIGAIANGRMTALRGNRPGWARAQYDRGPVNGAMRMSGLSLTFRLSASQQSALQQLLTEQQNPNSPNYHKWLTPEEYAQRFGMSESDLNSATSWLQSQGFAVTGISRSRSSISFSGTAAQVQAAFHTPIHNYVVNGVPHFANSAEPVLPAALAGVVLGIRHLNNYFPRPHSTIRRVSASQVTSHFTSSQTGNHFLSPGDFATIYNLTPLYNAGYDGTGQTIAVIGQTTISQSDVSAFRSNSGLSAVSSSNLQLLLVPGTGTGISCSGDVGEADLDVEWSGGVAKGATVLYVYAGRGGTGTTCSTRTANVFDALQYAIDNDLAPVLSISYGNCEANIGLSDSDIIQQWVQEANSQGQTLTAASGDDGAADCDADTSATQGLAVDIPAAIPEVTGVGGTEFTGDASSLSTTTYWTGASGSDVISSARSYIPEIAWNDTTADLAAGATSFSSSGGGASIFFTKPSWQTGAGVPGANHRYVPDVSLSASADHDGYLTCSQGSCTNGFRDGTGSLNVVGGTSVSSQVMGGILAVLNQATSSSGQGNANIEIYTLAASTPSAFHDITSGNNIVPCASGSTNCPATSPFQIGFSATTGYDEVTGLGTLDANELVQAWPGYGTASSYSISASPTTLDISPGNSKTSTMTVASSSGFSGTVTLSCSPQFTSAQVTCSMSPASVALDTNTTSATSTLTVTTVANSARSTTSADARRHGGLGWMAASSSALFAGVFVVGAPSRRRRWLALIGLAVLVSLAVGVGCGGGSSSSSSSGGGSTGSGGSTAGTYTFTVTATSGGTSQTAQVTVTVQ